MKQMSAYRHRAILSCFIVAALALLVSCQPSSRYRAAKPRLPCRVYGASDDAVIKLQAILEKSGVKTASMGQNYLISIPSDRIFADESPHLYWGSYALLNNVSCYLKQFRKVAVTITGYSAKYISADRERALTLTRARAVGDYLWSQGIDSRFIFTQGMGSDKPVIKYRKGGDHSANSRIEITFRRVVA